MVSSKKKNKKKAREQWLSYGNYDAPSNYCRSYGASEHGCYAAESHIGSGYGQHSSSSKNNQAHVGVVHQHQLRSSDPEIDLEGQRSSAAINNNSRRRGRRRGQDPPSRPGQRVAAAVVPPGARRTERAPRADCSWEGEPSYDSRDRDSSYCPTVATASTSASSGSMSSLAAHEDAIRRGIVDVSALVATYLAGALSFVVGIFLTLASPFVKVIKLIVGDLRGLLGDAAFLQEVGSLWRTYRDLRRRGRRDGGAAAADGHCGSSGYYDDESTDANSTVYTDGSSQFVGGWRPSADDGGGAGSGGGDGADFSRGSASRDRPARAATTSRPRSRRSNPPARAGGMSAASSYSSLPLVYQDHYRDQAVAPLPPRGSSSSHPGKAGPPDNRMHHREQTHQQRGGGGGDPHHGYYTSDGFPPQQHSRHHAQTTAPPWIASQQPLSSQYEQPYTSRTRHLSNSPTKPHRGVV